MYPVVIVPDEAGDILEQLGTKPKFWFSDEGSNRYLFKLNRSEGEDATGEDWSEKVVSELCEFLGLPHAHYEFAMWKRPAWCCVTELCAGTWKIGGGK
jgi:hypothetical protein